MKRPIALTIVAVWAIVAGMIGVVLMANALSPNPPDLDFRGPMGGILSVIGSGLYIYAGFELLRMHRLGLYVLLVAVASRLLVISVYERTRVGVGASIVLLVWVAVVLAYRRRLG
jgi:hypothetical protein